MMEKRKGRGKLELPLCCTVCMYSTNDEAGVFGGSKERLTPRMEKGWKKDGKRKEKGKEK